MRVNYYVLTYFQYNNEKNNIKLYQKLKLIPKV